MKAVIIEDETAAVSSLKAILRHNSVVDIEVVAELESIEDSIEWFRSSSQPDIIFMDIQMPELDGIEATIKILEFEERHTLPHIPIIALTANAFDTDRERAIKAGVDGYLTKPIIHSSIISILKKFLITK